MAVHAAITALAASIVVLAVAAHVVLRLLTPVRKGLLSDAYHFRDEKGVQRPFPSVRDPASVTLSVIIPCYDEEKRLPPTLDDTIAELERLAAEQAGFTWEIIVVDDASKDGTSAVAQRYTASLGADRVRVLRHKINLGKGGAVATGMVRCRGKYCLFADADGATSTSAIPKILETVKAVERGGLGVAIGSRAHLVNTDAVIKRSPIRNFLMYAFHMLVHVLGVRGIRDTQCGFKILTRESARRIFEQTNVEGWIFDIEVLSIAQRCGMPIVEMPVSWEEVPGSKMSLLRDSIRMLKDLVIIRYNYTLGYWKAV